MAEFVTLKKSDGTIIYPQITTDSITNGSITSDKIDWTTMTPASYYEVWPYAATTGTMHTSTALAGTYTTDTTLFSTSFTPRTSGKFLITMAIPAYGGASGTAFMRLNVGTHYRWTALPKSGDNKFNTNVITMVFDGTVGNSYTVGISTLISNSASITVPDYMGASISIAEL